MWTSKRRAKRVKWFLEKYNVDVVIETGTEQGRGVLEYLKVVNNVITVEKYIAELEVAEQNFEKAGFEMTSSTENLKIWKREDNTIHSYFGDSQTVLQKMIEAAVSINCNSFCFYLDAHDSAWDYNPIKDELKIIKNNKEAFESKIIIDDFYVPGYSGHVPKSGNKCPVCYRQDSTCVHWGFNMTLGNSVPLGYDYLASDIFNINDEYLIYYDNPSEPPHRGTAFIVPMSQQDLDEYLSFNRGIPSARYKGMPDTYPDKY